MIDISHIDVSLSISLLSSLKSINISLVRVKGKENNP